MKSAIVFGANGYIGRHLVKGLINKGIETLACDLSDFSIDKVEDYSQVDITKESEITKMDFSVDYIFIFSALTGTIEGFSNYNNFIEVNEVGLLNILDHYVSVKSHARLIFPSTRLVYKGVKNTPLHESAEKLPKTIYAQNKLSCENYLKIYQNMFNIEFTIFRICVPYGNSFDNKFSYGTIGFFLKKALNNESINLFGDGLAQRTFTHVEDIVSAILLAIDRKESKNDVFNIGSKDHNSLFDIANLIAKKFEIDVIFSDWPENALKLESGDTIFDDRKLKSLIGDSYRHTFADWVETL